MRLKFKKRSLINIGVMGVFIAALFAGTALAKEKEAELAYVEWADAIATAYVAQEILETEMGYDIKLTPVGAAAMWQALSAGDVDFTTAAWLPETHGHYLERVEGNVDDLGPNLEGAKIGLVVPEYVEIDSIEQINDHVDKFDGSIIGIDPGAGIMSAAEKALDEYVMDKMELKEGSDATMTAVLKDRIKNKQWVVVTGWTPHWKFGEWDLKYLDDPKNVFGGEETVNTVTRKGLKEDDPELYEFLDNFKWSLDDIHEVMAMNAEKDDPEKNAQKWVEENQDKVKQWLP